MSSDKDNSDSALMLTEVRVISASLTSLTRHVDRIDQRLGDVEHQLVEVHKDLVEVRKDTNIILTIAAATTETTSDLDDHKKQLQEHDRRITGLERAAA